MKKTTSTALLALTLGSVLAAASAPAMATGDNMEKCYGVSLKGKNDCKAAPAQPVQAPRKWIIREMPGNWYRRAPA